MLFMENAESKFSFNRAGKSPIFFTKRIAHILDNEVRVSIFRQRSEVTIIPVGHLLGRDKNTA